IVVGAAEQKFIIHKDLICHHSPFFRSAFNSRFMEGETQAMTLEDVDPAMFGAVVNWLYTQKIEEMQQDEDGHVVAIREGRLVLLGKLWMLGQRFMMPGFQNKVMSRLRSKVVLCGANDLRQFANYAWESNSDLLRRFAVDRFATMTEEKMFSDVVDDLPPGLLADIAKKMKHYYCSLATYDKEKMPDFEGNYKLDFE
ncbi:Kelch-like protein, partial [Lachnellula willkommii]